MWLRSLISSDQQYLLGLTLNHLNDDDDDDGEEMYDATSRRSGTYLQPGSYAPAKCTVAKSPQHPPPSSVVSPVYIPNLARLRKNFLVEAKLSISSPVIHESPVPCGLPVNREPIGETRLHRLHSDPG